uniref:Uncharacterized protein n=1 Tax=Panagrolaimus sp. JU765 TaxID=591449 RepID=A0AC34RJZ9_9BILA
MGIPKGLCRCGDGYFFKGYPNKCFDNYDTTQPILIYGRTKLGEIVGLHINDTFQFHEEDEINTGAMKPITGLKKATAIAVDSMRKILYFSDSKNYTISRRGIFDGEIQTIVENDLGNVEGIALDEFSGNLYYTDQAHSIIGVVNVEKPENRKILISTNLSNPRGIVVHPEKGYIFWTDWTDSNILENGKSKIERSKLDG